MMEPSEEDREQEAIAVMFGKHLIDAVVDHGLPPEQRPAFVRDMVGRYNAENRKYTLRVVPYENGDDWGFDLKFEIRA